MSRRRGPRPSGPSGIVTLLTDFGLDDAYVGTVKGVVLGDQPAGPARRPDPQGAAARRPAGRAAPRGAPGGSSRAASVHLAIVDPGVGGARRPIAIEAGGHYFVGPDNGLLGFCFDLPGARGVVLADARYHRRPVSRTFHGRDIFAPVAAHCSRGVRLAAFGPPLAPPGASVAVRAPAARRPGRRGGPAGRPLRQPPDESPRAGAAGPGRSGRPADRRRPRPWACGDLRRAAPAGARGGDRQLGPGRGVRAGGQRAPAARGRARAPPSAGGRRRWLRLRRRRVARGPVALRSRSSKTPRSRQRRPSRSLPGPRSGPRRRSTSSRPPSPSSGPRRGSR